LHIAGRDRPAVPHAVPMLYRPGENIGDRLDPAMRMPRKPRQVILRNVVAEVIEQQKRIEIRRVTKTKGAAKMHAGPFDGRLGADETFDGTDGHGWISGKRACRLS